jgi:DNA transposition AAA+ family ATPase
MKTDNNLALANDDETPTATPPKTQADESDETERLALIGRIEQLLAERPNVSWNNLSADIGVSPTTISQWRNDKYTAKVRNTNEKVRQWLARVAMSAEINTDLAVVKTRVHTEMMNALRMAQAIKGIVAVALGSGNGKTIMATEFCRKNTNAILLMADWSWRSPRGALVGLIAGITGKVPKGSLPVLIQEAEALFRKRSWFPVVNDGHLLGFFAVDLFCKIAEATGIGFAVVGHESMVHTWARSAQRDSEYWTRVQTRIFWCQPEPEVECDAAGHVVKTHPLFSRKEIGAIARQFLPDLMDDGLDLLCNTALCECLRAVANACRLARQIQIATKRPADGHLIASAIAMRTPKLTNRKR